MREIHQQLSDAARRHGWSVQALLTKSGLKISRSALQKRLRGQVPLRNHEVRALARTLGMEFTVTLKRRSAA